MGIFDSILGGDKNISLGTTSSSGTSGDQNDDTAQQQSSNKKIVPIIEEMTLIDTSLGEESDLPKATETVLIQSTQEVPSFNDSQSLDIGGSANVITETTSIIGSNPVVEITESTTTASEIPTEIENTLFVGTSIDLTPEPEKILAPLPGQDAWSEESSIHSRGNTESTTEGLLANPLPVEETGEVDAPDIFGGMNTEPVASEEQTFPEITPISESPSNIFGAFEQETSSESEVINIPDNAISGGEIPVIDSGISESPVIEIGFSEPETIHTLPISDSPVLEQEIQDTPIVSSFDFATKKISSEEKPNDTKPEESFFPILQQSEPQKKEEESKASEENPKDILKNTIDQLKDLRSTKNQLLKETRKQAEDYKESAKKMHDNEVKTRLLIKDIEAEIVRIGELIDVCYIQMREGTEKKTIPLVQKRIKGKLVKTQNKNIKKTTV